MLKEGERGHLKTAFNIFFMRLRWRVILETKILFHLKIFHPSSTADFRYDEKNDLWPNKDLICVPMTKVYDKIEIFLQYSKDFWLSNIARSRILHVRLLNHSKVFYYYNFEMGYNALLYILYSPFELLPWFFKRWITLSENSKRESRIYRFDMIINVLILF